MRMADEHEFEDDEFQELEEDLPEGFEMEAAGEEDEEVNPGPTGKRLKNAWQRLDRRGESKWLKEQLSDWDDWDESIDAL
jgi:hypothetical protein